MNVCVPPTVSEAVEGVTVIVVSTAGGFVTVTDAVPLTVPLVALTVAEPAANAVNTPALLIVPTAVLLLDHVMVTDIGLPF